jgi:hypothetical protein
VQLDELCAVVREVKAGHVSDAEAIERLERSPHWVWVALDPVSKLLLALQVGERTREMAQRLVHHVVQVLTPGCIPLFLTAGLKGSCPCSLGRVPAACGHVPPPCGEVSGLSLRESRIVSPGEWHS